MSKVAQKAQKTAQALKKSTKVTAQKVRKSVHFFKPKTLKLSRTGFEKTAAAGAKVAKKDLFAIIKAPLNSESAMKRIESQNTLTFIVDQHATKHQIKVAVNKLHGVKAAKVNTLNTPLGAKKAFIRLAADQAALDIANRLGLF